MSVPLILGLIVGAVVIGAVVIGGLFCALAANLIRRSARTWGSDETDQYSRGTNDPRLRHSAPDAGGSVQGGENRSWRRFGSSHISDPSA